MEILDVGPTPSLPIQNKDLTFLSLGSIEVKSFPMNHLHISIHQTKAPTTFLTHTTLCCHSRKSIKKCTSMQKHYFLLFLWASTYFYPFSFFYKVKHSSSLNPFNVYFSSLTLSFPFTSSFFFSSYSILIHSLVSFYLTHFVQSNPLISLSSSTLLPLQRETHPYALSFFFIYILTPYLYHQHLFLHEVPTLSSLSNTLFLFTLLTKPKLSHNMPPRQEPPPTLHHIIIYIYVR